MIQRTIKGKFCRYVGTSTTGVDVLVAVGSGCTVLVGIGVAELVLVGIGEEIANVVRLPHIS